MKIETGIVPCLQLLLTLLTHSYSVVVCEMHWDIFNVEQERERERETGKEDEEVNWKVVKYLVKQTRQNRTAMLEVNDLKQYVCFWLTNI